MDIPSFTETISSVALAFATFFSSLDWMYILGVVFIGRFFTNDNLVKAFPIKATLQRVDKAWRVAFISMMFSLCIYILRGYHNLPAAERNIHIETMIYSFFVANGLYALILKFIFNLFKSKTQ